MILTFKDKETARIAAGHFSRRFPHEIQKRTKALIDRLRSTVTINELRVPPSLRLEKLKGNRAGQYSIRVNDQFRICFCWTSEGATQVELTDYH